MKTITAILYFIIFISTTLPAADNLTLFQANAASIRQVIGKKAHWKHDTDFTANIALSTQQGKEYCQISYSKTFGDNGVGIVIIPIKVQSSKAKSAGNYQFNINLGYEGKKRLFWKLIAYFSDKNQATTSLRIVPGFKNYSIPATKWQTKGELDWSKCNKIVTFLYQTSYKNGVFPTIYLGNIKAVKVFQKKPVTVNDRLPISYQVVLSKAGRANATAIIPAEALERQSAEDNLKRLEQRLKVKFPKIIADKVGSSLKPGNYLLFSHKQQDSLSRRLAANSLISSLKQGYEVRTIPNCFKRGVNLLYIGYTDKNSLAAACSRLLKSGKLTAAMSRYLDKSSPDNEQLKIAKHALGRLEKLYAPNSSIDKKNTAAFKLLNTIAGAYYNSNNEQIISLFCRGIEILRKNYRKAVNNMPASMKIPSFHFPALVIAALKVDSSPTISSEQRLKIANIIATISDDIMNFWEMRKPLAMYQNNRVEFVENHALFASRGIIQAANYLTERFNLPRMDYYRQVAEFAFRGVDNLKQQPEDAGGYQFICRMHWLEICQKLGLNYDTPNLRYFIDFTIAQINQLGSAGCYGDSSDLYSIYGWNFLLAGLQLYHDKLAAHLLTRQLQLPQAKPWLKQHLAGIELTMGSKYTPRMLGLKTFPVDRELLKYYGATKLNHNPPLNKAVFRSGYEKDDNYLMLGGMNSTDPHSHRDANTILQYSRGPYYWLTDISYYRKNPDAHNGLVIAADNQVPDLRRRYKLKRHSFAEINGAYNAPDKQMAILSTTLYDYGSANWNRHILWDRQQGFWVIDKVTAKKSAHYEIKRRWNLLGKPSKEGNIFTFTQQQSRQSKAPFKLYLGRGDDAFTLIHNRTVISHKINGTIYQNYRYADPLVKVVVEASSLKLQPGENYYLADNFTHNKSSAVKRLTTTAWISDTGSARQFVAMDSFIGSKLEFEGDCLFISDNHIMGLGVKKLKIAGKTIAIAASGKIYQPISNELRQILAELAQSATNIELSKTANITKPLLNNIKIIAMSKPVVALGMGNNNFMVGDTQGIATLFDFRGKKLWERALQAPITGIAAVKSGKETFWAIGTGNSSLAHSTGSLFLFDSAGKRQWKQTIAKFGHYPGYVRAVTAAKLLPGDEEQIVIGGRNKKVIAFNLAGKKLWERKVYHPTSKLILAADLNNDGLDEIAASELWRTNYIFSPKGKVLQQTIRTIGYDRAVAAIPLATGSSEVIWGNSDSYLRAIGLNKKFGELWSCNAGGIPTGIVYLGAGTFAAANNNNCVEVFTVKGQRTGKRLYFPAAIKSLVGNRQALYAFCEDGYLYKFTIQGGISHKYHTDYLTDIITPEVNLKLHNDKLVLTVKNKIFIH